MKHPYHFLLKKSQSPTHYNLRRYLQEQGWRSSRFKWQVNFSDENLQFDVKAAQALEFKHLLAQLVRQYCPQVMPLTYCINDQDWPDVLQRIADEYYLKQDYQLIDQIDNLV
jgi:hypothetical protein